MYASVGQVETYVPGRAPFTATSRPSASQVYELLVNETAEIEACLTKGGYGLPIATTATVALAQIRTACLKCTAAAVEAVAPNADDKKRALAQKMCEEAKAMIAAGQLPGVDRDTAESNPRSGYSPTAFIRRDMDL